jgi:C-terminal peptidase prc
MRRNEQVWWVAATALSLAAFSFFAGLGLRGLHQRLTQTEPTSASIFTYPQIASAAPRAVPDPDLKPGALFHEVLQKLKVYYVEPLPSGTKLSYGAIDAMLNELKDPNTRFLTREEVEALRAASLGQYSGLGAVLTIRRQAADEATAAVPARERSPSVRTITVVSVPPGSPAEKAGLKPGDRITELNGRWIAPVHLSFRALTQLTDDLGPQDYRPRDPEEPVEPREPDPERQKARKELDEARSRWRNSTELPIVMQTLVSEDRGEHELTIERGQPAKTLKIKVNFGRTKVDAFSSRRLNDSTGYVQILAFNSETPKRLGDVLAEFQQSGIKNLVVDLRNNPGGSIEAARDAAGLLLGQVKLAVLQERDASRKLVDRGLFARGAARFKPASTSVLVDGGTAGSAELVAAALRDHLGAHLVGSTTFGDGTEQELIPLETGAGISITRAKMLTSKSLDFEGKGLKADVAPQGDPIETAVKTLSKPPLNARAAKKA